MYHVLIYDLIVSVGIGYGIIGNAIRYSEIHRDIYKNIQKINNVTYTQLDSRGKLISTASPVNPIYETNRNSVVNATTNSTLIKNKYLTKFNITLLGSNKIKEQYYINTEHDFLKLCDRVNVESTRYKLSFPISVKEIFLDTAFIGNKYLSINKSQVFGFELFNNRLPLSLTLIVTSVFLFGFSHMRYNKSSYGNLNNSLLAPIFTKKRYLQIFNGKNIYT
jgi:hypothetical protein